MVIQMKKVLTGPIKTRLKSFSMKDTSPENSDYVLYSLAAPRCTSGYHHHHCRIS